MIQIILFFLMSLGFAETLPVNESITQSGALFALANTSDHFKAKTREGLHEKGLELIEPVLEQNPDTPEVLALFAAHKGSLAGIRKNLWALMAIGSVERALKKLSEKTPSYGDGAGDRGLGSMYLKAPSFVSVGDLEKAKLHLTRAYQNFPNNNGNRVAYAELLIELDRVDEAKAIAKTVIDQLKELHSKGNSPVEYLDWLERANAIVAN